MSQKLILQFQQKFGVLGNVQSDDVTTRLAELDPFLDGFFLGVVLEKRIPSLNPIVESMQHMERYDEVIDYTRISIAVNVSMNWPADLTTEIQTAFNNSMDAFLGSRFPTDATQ